MNAYIYCFILSLLFLAAALYFSKTRVLNFKYSVFWISISLILIMLSLNKRLTEKMAGLVNISYAPAFLFVTGIVFAFFLIFYLTITISSLQNKITKLVQEIGIIKSTKGNGDS
ncbi:DUF2304 domain-containing protein [Lutispora saccharofermentans]|uniref:DUF2304 domain-containing protein n=1 Tax=Lutispora saccharofermentans TaxID=3024236 RepID=A0ABT1NJC4_9FIRM|nr:DUF2304 domain-containing protein [Lutispora saccharofermentans]MCQ1531174.1 DUF2304 domain-containing protein [Lutispora saccharofermentans]